MPTLFQLVLLAAFAVALALTVKRGRQGAISRTETLGWGALWLAAAVVALLPEVTSLLARVAGVGRGADFVLYVSVAALFYLVFRIFVRLDKLDRDISALVRQIAVREGLRGESRGEAEKK